MHSVLASFARILVLGDVPTWLIAALDGRGVPWSASAGAADARSWCLADDVIERSAAHAGGHRTLVVTALPLHARRTPQLFGFADPRRQIAVVSTARLIAGGDVERWRQRLANVVAHEAGHLDRLGHCPTPRCVMSSVRGVADIDQRSAARCGRCPRTGVMRRSAAAVALVAACVVAFAVLDRLALGLNPPPVRPFTCARDDAQFDRLLFNGAPIPAGVDASGPFVTCRTSAEADTLNAAFQQLDPPDVEGMPASVQQLLRAKGRADERCPGCHIVRRADTLAAARFMRGMQP